MPLFNPPILAPLIIGCETVNLTVNSSTLTANIVYLYAFELNTPVSVTAVKWRNAATATGHTNMGMYTYAGNLVSGSDSGAVVNAVSTVGVFTYGSAIALAPGYYFLALACDNSTDTYDSTSPLTTALVRNKRATNSLAAGALPSTTGAIVSSVVVAPSMAALVSGGVS